MIVNNNCLSEFTLNNCDNLYKIQRMWEKKRNSKLNLIIIDFDILNSIQVTRGMYHHLEFSSFSRITPAFKVIFSILFVSLCKILDYEKTY